MKRFSQLATKVFALTTIIWLVVLVFAVPVLASSGAQELQPTNPLADMIPELLGLSLFIFAAVAYLKQAGVTGQALTYSGFGVGLVFGIAYRYAVSPMVDFPGWFWAVVFGLMAGFLATGAYKGGQSLISSNQ